MSAKIQAANATELQPATTITKRNFTLPIALGGASGQVAGASQWAFIKLPSPFTGNQLFNIMGGDFDRNGLINVTGQTGLVIGGPSSANSTRRMRWRIGTSNRNSDSMSQFADGTGYLMGWGTANAGSNGTPDWREFIAFCPVGGTPESAVFTHISAHTSSSTTAMLANIGSAIAGAASARTPVGFEYEHVAYIDGDFPWDSLNNRPHHDAIAALAGSGIHPFRTYAELIAQQNAGTLPYANQRSNGDASNPRNGRSEMIFYVPLRSIADLTNQGTGPANTLQKADYNGLTDGFVASTPLIAPPHWTPGTTAPSINDPQLRGFGGAGTRTLSFSGTYDLLNTTALQRRLTYDTSPVNEGAVAGAVVPGFNWSTAGMVLEGGVAICNIQIPYGGPYVLEWRDANDNLVMSAPLGKLVVGLSFEVEGQSGARLAMLTNAANLPLGPNNLGVALPADALGYAFVLNNNEANGASYLQPTPPPATSSIMLPGTTPNVGHGLVECVKEFSRHFPRMPLILKISAVNGIGMDSWNADAFVKFGSVFSASWKYRGTKGAVPGPLAADGAGIMGYSSRLTGGYVDGFITMWTGIEDTKAGRQAWLGHLANYYDANPNPLQIVFPPWRGHREPPDGNATVNNRASSMLFATEADECGPNGVLAPCLPDFVSDNTESLHSASEGPFGPGGGPVSDANKWGQASIGITIGREIARAYNRKIKPSGHPIVGAWFGNPGRTRVVVQLPRQMRTLIDPVSGLPTALSNRFSFSLNNGTAWGTAGFAGQAPDNVVAVTATLHASGWFVFLDRASGAWPETGLRVDWCREWPFGPTEMPDEANAEVMLRGLLYDLQTFRGATNLAVPRGAALCNVPAVGTGQGGVPVAAKGAPTVRSYQKMAGSRTVTFKGKKISTGEIVEKTFTLELEPA